MIKKLTSPGKLQLPRVAAVGVITLVAWAMAMLFTTLASGPSGRANDFFYDVFYRLRPQTDMHNAQVVLVAVDQKSLTAVDQRFKYGWPWPREFFGQIATYLDKAGARAIVFDIVFVETSAYQNRTGDDDNFAEALNGIKTPLIFGSSANPGAAWEKFAPAVRNPTFGAVNVGNDKIFRWYTPEVNGLPSLAASTIRAAGAAANPSTPEPFRLCFYGPHLRADGHQTFTYISAAGVLGAQIDGPDKARGYGISPDMFKDKIVLVGVIAAGGFDLKSSPLSDEYPGPEVHATAIENLLRGDRVWPVSSVVVAIVSLLCGLAVSTGVVLPRGASLKLLAPIAGISVLLGIAIALFRGNAIRWLPPLLPLLAIVLATPLAFAWTYFAEDRQRRFMLKALSKVVSPAVADRLARDPGSLARGTVRTDLTLLFTDLANFTDLSEGMDVQQLTAFMNRYLGDMSDQVFAQDGTLDKYIGDAVMAFWNAPLPQADHAARACRAALQMLAREPRLREEFLMDSGDETSTGRKGAAKVLFTRIGINTATVAVGFIGSEHLFNYTALGDGVNLASRLEGANKLYGTRILVSQNTAALIGQGFWLRKIDVLRVKGKKEPMAVFELIAERVADDPALAERIKGYEEAFAAYRARQWDHADQMLLELSRRFGQDGPVAALLARVREYRLDPPGDAWDGVYDATIK